MGDRPCNIKGKGEKSFAPIFTILWLLLAFLFFAPTAIAQTGDGKHTGIISTGVGVGGATTEAELESDLTDVTDVYTNNDGVLGGLNWINKTANYTASAGEGILVNTDTGAFIITLPTGATSDIVGVIDEDDNAETNNITITPASGERIMGTAVDESMTISTNGASVRLVYSSDASEGWKIESATATGVSWTTGITVGSGIKHDGFVIRDAAEIQTTDATQTTLESITLLAGNTYHIEAWITGSRSDVADTHWASYSIACTGKRHSTGGSIVSTTTSSHTAETSSNNPNLDATFTASSNNINISVTGLASEIWEWTATMKYINGSE